MSNTAKNALYSLVLVLLVLGVFWFRQSGQETVQENKEPVYRYITGTTMGVIQYNIKYLDPQDRVLKAQVDSLLYKFNMELSVYEMRSTLTKINADTSGEFNYKADYLFPVLEISKKVYEETEGAFDPTVGPLVNAWGFGRQEILNIPSDENLEKLKASVGMDKLAYDEKTIRKSIPNLVLNFNAVAKGYAVDLIAEYFESIGVENYLVEIGRELRAKGMSEKGDTWLIGIVNPKYKEENQNKLGGRVRLENRSLATSGNYENFFVKDGKKYAHTIDPRLGKPVEHNLLSASVFAPNCALADAYATGFMVLGTEKAKEIAEAHPDVDVYLIYTDDAGEMQVYSSPGIADKIELDN